MKSHRIITVIAGCIMALSLTVACGPKQEESWNSYYYGTARKSAAGVAYDKNRYPADNDDTYVLPPGTWNDDQTPQHPNWSKVR